ncbi:MAG: NimC/NimA family protein [Eubacteriaceae bacterium]|nr:NimC/NimA family protein [Eubacteriaceae bacterium]
MPKGYEFLKEAGTYFIATVDKDQAKVRPFGSLYLNEGKAYIVTANTKDCYKQMLENPKVEIAAMGKGGWIRVTCKAVPAQEDAAQAVLNANERLKERYTGQAAETFALMELTDVSAAIYKGSEIERVEF